MTVGELVSANVVDLRVWEASGSQGTPGIYLLGAPGTALPFVACRTWKVGTERAQAAGLRCRPVAETVADVWAWLRDGGESELDDWRSEHRPPPMEKAREEALLGT